VRQHLKRGNKGIGAPIIIRARSRPNLPSCESLYGLSRTGLRNALPEASADPYGKSSRLLVGNHRRFALKDLQVVKGITLPLARPPTGTLTCIALALTQRDREHDERT
jgi:hypothetical protein